MKVFGLQRGFYQVSRLNIQDLSPVAKERLRILKLWDALRQKGTNSFEAPRALRGPKVNPLQVEEKAQGGRPKGP